jgi:hypothetical protein
MCLANVSRDPGWRGYLGLTWEMAVGDLADDEATKEIGNVSVIRVCPLFGVFDRVIFGQCLQ